MLPLIPILLGDLKTSTPEWLAALLFPRELSMVSKLPVHLRFSRSAKYPFPHSWTQWASRRRNGSSQRVHFWGLWHWRQWLSQTERQKSSQQECAWLSQGPLVLTVRQCYTVVNNINWCARQRSRLGVKESGFRL